MTTAFSLRSSTRSPSAAAVSPRPDQASHEPGRNVPSDALYHRIGSVHPACRRPRRACAIKQQSPIRVRERPSSVLLPGSWRKMQSLVFAVVLCLLVCCHGVAAQEVYTAEPWEGLADLVFDHSPPPSKPVRLQARQESSEAFPSATRVGDATGASASTSSAATSSATSDSPSSLPTPFDSSLGNNFTAPSCPAFFDTFMNNATFNHCRPLSLLLQVCICSKAPLTRSL